MPQNLYGNNSLNFIHLINYLICVRGNKLINNFSLPIFCHSRVFPHSLAVLFKYRCYIIYLTFLIHSYNRKSGGFTIRQSVQNKNEDCHNDTQRCRQCIKTDAAYNSSADRPEQIQQIQGIFNGGSETLSNSSFVVNVEAVEPIEATRNYS